MKAIKIAAAALLILIVLGYGFLQLINSTSFQLFGEIIHKAETEEKVVALTFDDGPTMKTEDILKILQEKDIKATFFLTGKEIEENMEEAKKIALAGHEVGNHTFSHQRMVFKSPSFIKEEVENTDKLIREIGYEGDILFRPPYGKKLFFLPKYLADHDRKSILWDIEPETDPEIGADSEKIVQHVSDHAKSGSIILLHVMYDSRKESLGSVEGIINKLTEQGYEFKTVSELLKYEKANNN
ncbi:polysaccharide deacetylase [Bacillus sp. SA1-12]|uniref:polysaccharide deacetylase family protein n=1 Tax=Bacillus sp. SA1-12 TaxID=1455638 RepID=UPI0006255258|nr:polysaccharide deacetylase family protein [Bacillus sp. SA1-12]KKI93471.1 polysaccharide deacetylase [Bacillus sp. SA1-12]